MVFQGLSKEKLDELYENEELKSRLLKDWADVWDSQIKSQTLFSIAYLLHGISTLAIKENLFMRRINGETIDPRLPMIFVSPSGTGKGIGSSFYEEIFGDEKIGLKIRSLSKPTLQKLTGSFNTSIEEMNRKKGLEPGNPKYKDPIIRGYFEILDDIIFDEAEYMFNNSPDAYDRLRILRRVIDKYGSQNNLISSETLKNESGHQYYCKCNFSILTYDLDGFSDLYMKNGIFQRCLSFQNDIDEEDFQRLILSTNEPNNLGDIFEERKKGLIAQILKTKNFIKSLNDKGKTFIEISEDAKKIVNYDMKDRISRYRNTILKDEDDNVTVVVDEDQSKALRSFLPRYYVLISKIAMSIALMNEKEIIDEQVMNEALIIGSSVFESTIYYLIYNNYLNNKLSEDLKLVINKFPRNKIVSTTQIIEFISKIKNVSQRSAWNTFLKIRNVAFVQTNKGKEGKNNQKYYKLNM